MTFVEISTMYTYYFSKLSRLLGNLTLYMNNHVHRALLENT